MTLIQKEANRKVSSLHKLGKMNFHQMQIIRIIATVVLWAKIEGFAPRYSLRRQSQGLIENELNIIDEHIHLDSEHYSRIKYSCLWVGGKNEESIEDLWSMEDEDDDDDDEDIHFDLNEALGLSLGEDDEEEDDEEEDEEDESSTNTYTRDIEVAEKEVDEVTTENPVAMEPIRVQPKTPTIERSDRTVGVGRNGYNMTTLHNVEYEVKRYFPENDRITYQIRLDLLKQYHAKKGDCNIPFRYSCDVKDYDVDGSEKGTYKISLGRWLHTLRMKYEKDKSKIPKAFREELDSLKMNWEGVGAGNRPTQFRKRCKELKAFVKKNGHDRVPTEGETKSLGIWVDRYRALYRKYLDGDDCGKQLTEERIKLLRDSGFDMDAIVDKSRNGKYSARQSLFDQEWERKFLLLSEFKSETGHFDIIKSIGYPHFAELISFVAEQKHQYNLVRNAYSIGTKKFKSTMTPYRFKTLSDLGFKWDYEDIGYPTPWIDIARSNFEKEEWISKLKNFQNEFGRCEVTLRDVYSSDDILSLLLLYTFQQRLRWEYRHLGQGLHGITSPLLDQDTVETLEKMGFSWYRDSYEDPEMVVLEEEYEWWEFFHDLMRYKSVSGDFHLEPGVAWYSEELDDYLSEQKMKYFMLKGEKLTAEEDYEDFMSEWHYLALNSAAFEQGVGDDILPKNAGRKPAVLELERELFEELDELPADLQDTPIHGQRIDKAEQLAWLVRFASLRRYYEKGGTGALSNISADDESGQRLALWANHQRKQYSAFKEGKKSTLTKRRIDMLNSIDFDWKIKSPWARDEWEEMKRELIKFRDHYGHCFVPCEYKNKRLGQWVLLQRQLYRQSRSKPNHDLILPTSLSKEREKELISIGLDLTMDSTSFGSMTYETVSISLMSSFYH